MKYILVSTGDIVEFISNEEPTKEYRDFGVVWNLGYMEVRDSSLTLHEVEEVPLGRVVKDYCYRNGEFIPNPNPYYINVAEFSFLMHQIKVLQQCNNNLYMDRVLTEMEMDERLSYVELGLKTANKQEVNDMQTYDNCIEIIKAKKKTREEMMYALDIFLLNSRITPNQYTDLITLMDDTGLVIEVPPVEEVPTEEIPSTEEIPTEDIQEPTYTEDEAIEPLLNTTETEENIPV